MVAAHQPGFNCEPISPCVLIQAPKLFHSTLSVPRYLRYEYLGKVHISTAIQITHFFSIRYLTYLHRLLHHHHLLLLLLLLLLALLLTLFLFLLLLPQDKQQGEWMPLFPLLLIPQSFFDESFRMGCGEADNGKTRGCTNRSPTHRLVRQLAPMEYLGL